MSCPAPHTASCFVFPETKHCHLRSHATSILGHHDQHYYWAQLSQGNSLRAIQNSIWNNSCDLLGLIRKETLTNPALSSQLFPKDGLRSSVSLVIEEQDRASILFTGPTRGWQQDQGRLRTTRLYFSPSEFQVQLDNHKPSLYL